MFSASVGLLAFGSEVSIGNFLLYMGDAIVSIMREAMIMEGILK